MSLLFFILILSTGVCPIRSDNIYVKAGEMVALMFKVCNRSDAETLWKNETNQMYLHNIPVAEQRQMGVVVHQNSLVILNASADHEGNYSCPLRNATNQSWFRLIVYPPQSKEYEEETQYSATCFAQESCTLRCPDVNIPSENTPNMTSYGIIWHKEGESSRKRIYFPSVGEKDIGVYNCTRSYLYHGQIYNMTFRVVLEVKPKKKDKKYAKITEPQDNKKFLVDLDSTVKVVCKAVLYSEFDDVFWLSDQSFVGKDDSLPVFYNCTRDRGKEEIMVTATLVFRKVSKEDLSKRYTCKLQSVNQLSSFVTITLTQKSRPSYISLTLCIITLTVVLVVPAVIYVKFKVDITLFIRDTLGCHRSNSDGKSYDAFLMCSKSNTDGGLNAQDRKILECVLEERFGYSLCLFDRDVLPGEAITEAVLDCIERSRTVVLVPTSPDPGLGSGLLSAIHAALVERQARLVFINTDTTEALSTGSVAEALQLLSEAGDHVTWEGRSSMLLSSVFWKQLRYYLPPPQHAPEIKLLPQTIQDTTPWENV